MIAGMPFFYRASSIPQYPLRLTCIRAKEEDPQTKAKANAAAVGKGWLHDKVATVGDLEASLLTEFDDFLESATFSTFNRPYLACSRLNRFARSACRADR